MKAREKSLEQAHLLTWWANRGRNDAHELGFEYYDGAENTEYRDAYVRAFTDEKAKIQAGINEEIT